MVSDLHKSNKSPSTSPMRPPNHKFASDVNNSIEGLSRYDTEIRPDNEQSRNTLGNSIQNIKSGRLINRDNSEGKSFPVAQAYMSRIFTQASDNKLNH